MLGLTIAYLNDEEIRLASRSAMALALMPKEYVEKAFELLKQDSPTEMADFFDYVQKQWFKRISPNYWVVSDLDWRTNNFSEGTHLLSSSKSKDNALIFKVGTINSIIELANIIRMSGIFLTV